MKKILVIGDTILDKYRLGDVERISPEAPVPILQFESESESLGGACNVAANIRTLCEVKHDIDYFGMTSLGVSKLLRELSINPIGVSIPESVVLQKIRYTSNNHHLLRMDIGKSYSKGLILVSNKLIRGLELEKYDLIVISDYNKGIFNEEMAEYIFESYKGKILIDLKSYKPWVSNLDLSNTIVKCNEKEFTQNKVDILLYSNVKNIVETLGKNGYAIMKSYNDKGDNNWRHRPSTKLTGNIVDVVGAGDTFLAGMVSSIIDLENEDIEDIAEFGNLAAGKKVQKFGTNTVSFEEICNE